MTIDAECPAAALTDWAMTEGREIQSTPAFMGAFCRRLRAAGAPVWRVSVQIRMLHPQLRGTTLIWQDDLPEVQVLDRPHGTELTQAYRDSPLRACSAARPLAQKGGCFGSARMRFGSRRLRCAA